MVQSIGDLAISFSNRSANVRIRTEMNTLVQELTTGRKSDIRSALSGELGPIAMIERSLSNATAYQTVINETELFLTTVQNSLSLVSEQLETLASAAFDMGNTSNPSLIANFGKQSRNQFESLVNTLNTSVAGRSLFAGNETATQPLGDPANILDDLVAALPPDALAEDVLTAVDAYFAVGGGFETARYLGSNTDLSPFRLSPKDVVTFDITANTDEIRGALAATATAALLDRGVLSNNNREQNSLIRQAGLNLFEASTGVITVRGEVGVLENRLETARTRNSVETDTLAMARAEMVGADPFETATRLQMVQTQLDTFYTLTARLSQLNLTGYLR